MPQEYTPGTREIVQTIVDIWKQDPESENLSYAKLLARVKSERAADNWVLSEKRMKAALKEFNLQPNKPKFTYVKETKTDMVAGMQTPAGTKLQMTKGRGKALYATKNFKAGEKIWEEVPAVQAAAVEMLRLMRSGKCCSYCSKTLRVNGDGSLAHRAGIACIHCTANWCSNNCKRLDIGHGDTHHEAVRKGKAHIVTSRWKLYEQFCMDQNWNAGFLYAMLLLHKIKHDPTSHYYKVMSGMARIRQDIRQRAVSDPGTIEFEQHEEMWKKGHELLAAAVKPSYDLSFDEYLEGIGLVNLNNLKGCIFEIHANLNHNCQPNLNVCFKSDSKAEGIVVTANTDIDMGQELTTTYVDPSLRVDDRQSRLRINWGFNCACARCKREKAIKCAPEPAKPALKAPVAPDSPKRTRTKSVHFETNPVSLEVSSG